MGNEERDKRGETKLLSAIKHGQREEKSNRVSRISLQRIAWSVMGDRRNVRRKMGKKKKTFIYGITHFWDISSL